MAVFALAKLPATRMKHRQFTPFTYFFVIEKTHSDLLSGFGFAQRHGQ